MNTRNWSRREVLAAGLTAAGTLALGGRVPLAAQTSASEKEGPFRLGLQSYSLRGFTKDGKPDLAFAEALAAAVGFERVIAAVDSRGGHVVSVPMKPTYSTTELIERIQRLPTRKRAAA